MSLATAMQALSTVFTPPTWCANRFAVYIATDEPRVGTSTVVPSSGWIDPSFTKCVPSQYTAIYPTFSPGVCPHQMTIVSSTRNVDRGKTIWTGGCCQSGFATIAADPEYICTSIVTTPMVFLLIPNISTADVYTTLSTSLSIQHDMLTVQWEQSDLNVFPREVATHYASMMGIMLSSPAPTADQSALPTSSAIDSTPMSTDPSTSSSAPTISLSGTSLHDSNIELGSILSFGLAGDFDISKLGIVLGHEK
ncbi:hypothetical protein F5Y15DRAFT_416630 [Xylariaceae sp. FL0016]|nr:hypothetical protein F5Y15DRAFT_416630 [Xylariaceae sp. FL0016]